MSSDIERNRNTKIGSKSEKSSSSNIGRVVFSYFGQINNFKGIDILIDAISLLPKHITKQLIVNINGSGLENASDQFRKYVNKSVEKSNGVIRLRGRYERSELRELMNGTDWVIISSKWWENSPMVILEAKKYSVPVIASNIGGMKEKIKNGENGFHFQMGRPDSLADVMEYAVLNPDIQQEMAASIGKEYDPDKDYNKHLDVYRNLISSYQVSADRSTSSSLNQAA